MTLPILLIQRAEDELLGCLMFSQLARDTAKEKGLKAEHFSDYYLTGHGNRARYYSAIIDSPIGDIFPAVTLINRNQFKSGDGSNLVGLMAMAVHVAPSYDEMIDLIQRGYIERQTARGNLDAAKNIRPKPKIRSLDI